jgi:hypothetical protein
MLNMTNGVRGGTMCLSKAGLAEGTNANTIKTAAPNGAGIDFVIDGIAYHLADGDNIAMTALDAQAALTTCLYLVTVNAAGTVAMVKGDEVLTASLSGGDAVLRWPEPAAGYCPIGAIKIATAAATTFTSGTTDLSATGITDTYYDLMTIPPQPLTS